VAWESRNANRSPRIHHPIRIYRISFGIGLPALPAAPIDKGDKCTHRASLAAEEDGRLSDDGSVFRPSFARFVSKFESISGRDKLY
jgi:hypothetical protein